AGCQGNLLCASASASFERDSGSTHWRFLAPQNAAYWYCTSGTVIERCATLTPFTEWSLDGLVEQLAIQVDAYWLGANGPSLTASDGQLSTQDLFTVEGRTQGGSTVGLLKTNGGLYVQIGPSSYTLVASAAQATAFDFQ